MFRVTCEIEFCYGHRLLGYEGKCRHLHGHNGKAAIVLEASTLDDKGMVLDFAEIKRAVKRWIDESLDHRLLLRNDDPLVRLLQEAGEPMFLLDVNPTAENIARLVFEHTADQGFPVIEVNLWETPGCFATYCRNEFSTDRIQGTEIGSHCAPELGSRDR